MIFVDTSFLYAGLVSKDAHHEEAVALTRSTADQHLVTTNQVVGECWSLLNRRWGHSFALRFLDRASQTGMIEARHLDEEIEGRAFGWLRRHDERAYSFVDATSFAFMEANGITEALAFDGDFAAAGFAELRP